MAKPKREDCKHPPNYIVTLTNSKGRQYRECSYCYAFLGWV